MTSDLSKYKTWFFDCDGVLLDSNHLKSEAYYELAKPFGESYAKTLVTYHKKFGGISRFEKIKYFFEIILNQEDSKNAIQKSIGNYAELVKQKLIQCFETPGVRDLLENIPSNCKKYVVSGAPQNELEDVFKRRERLDKSFDKIYGSPDSKETIFNNILFSAEPLRPAVFIGDSLYDFQMSKQFKLDFIFMTQFTEFQKWGTFFKDKHNVTVIRNLNNLLTIMR